MFDATGRHDDLTIALSFRSTQKPGKKKEPRAQQKKMDQRFAKEFHRKRGSLHALSLNI